MSRNGAGDGGYQVGGSLRDRLRRMGVSGVKFSCLPGPRRCTMHMTEAEVSGDILMSCFGVVTHNCSSDGP